MNDVTRELDLLGNHQIAFKRTAATENPPDDLSISGFLRILLLIISRKMIDEERQSASFAIKDGSINAVFVNNAFRVSIRSPSRDFILNLLRRGPSSFSYELTSPIDREIELVNNLLNLKGQREFRRDTQYKTNRIWDAVSVNALTSSDVATRHALDLIRDLRTDGFTCQGGARRFVRFPFQFQINSPNDTKVKHVQVGERELLDSVSNLLQFAMVKKRLLNHNKFLNDLNNNLEKCRELSENAKDSPPACQAISFVVPSILRQILHFYNQNSAQDITAKHCFRLIYSGLRAIVSHNATCSSERCASSCRIVLQLGEDIANKIEKRSGPMDINLLRVSLYNYLKTHADRVNKFVAEQNAPTETA